jgi:hypothetical protein
MQGQHVAARPALFTLAVAKTPDLLAQVQDRVVAGEVFACEQVAEVVLGERPVDLAQMVKQEGHHARRSETACADRAVAVILTGMGRDGAAGLAALRQGGASTIAQDEATSLVYGMPRAAWELGAVEQRLPLPQIAQAALRAARGEASR